MISFLAHSLLFQALVAAFLVDENDRAQYHHLRTDAEERPQRRQLVCLQIHRDYM